eukprot:GHVH01011044.1.p1 GENE.GHVH01011044.1~~GHVH01011044.1.p1  ORF type:complete len:571 (+),score=101.56 GHVH01011044.1:103-1815(+)
MDAVKRQSDEWLEMEGGGDEEVRKCTALRDKIIDQLRLIIDPDIGKDIVACNFIKDLVIHQDTGSVDFTLELTTMACPVKDVFEADCQRLLLELDEVNDVNINVTARKSEQGGDYAGHKNASSHLLSVASVIAVASGKGGVGKSSLCVNIAFMLSNMGARVGIVDCDVYGPSLPTMIPVSNPTVYFTNTKEEVDRVMMEKRKDGSVENDAVIKAEMLHSGSGGMLPIEYMGVKMMSYGYLRPGANKFIGVRGPLASSLVYQMVTQTQWGDLDYLFLDLPPGTGDIHLTLGQSVPITGAICVTTSSPLAIADTLKGLHMFSAIEVPPLAVVENMAYLPCPKCSHEIQFQPNEEVSTPTTMSSVEGMSPGYEDDDDDAQINLASIIEQFGIKLVAKLPMDRQLQQMVKVDKKTNKKKAPYVNWADHKSPLYVRLKDFCSKIVQEIAITKYAGDLSPDIKQSSDGFFTMAFKSKTQASETVYVVACRLVRLKCRCAECIDEFTGRVRLNPKSIPELVYVEKIKRTGNYAATFTWHDGHQSIIPFTLLESIAKQSNAQSSGSNKDCTVSEANNW